MNKTSLQRTLTPNEKLYVAADALNYSFLLQLVLEMNSEVDLPSLNKALIQTFSLNPLSPLKIHSKSHLDQVTTIETEWDGQDIQSPDFLHGPKFHSNHIPLQVLYIKGTRHFLVFRVFHGFMDGMGLYHWVKEVFRAWKNQPLLGSQNTITDYDFLKQQKKVPFRPNYSLDCIAPTGQTGEKHTHHQWHKVTLSGKISAIAAKICHMLSMRSTAQGAEKTRFMVPVDLRGYIPEINTTTNFANPIFVEAQKNTSWQNIFSDMSKQLGNHNELMAGQYDLFLHHTPLPLLKGMLKALIAYQNKKNRYMVSGIISKMTINLAELDTEHCKAIDGYFLPVNPPISPITLIITEHNEATSICFSISNAHATPEECIHLTQQLQGLSKDATSQDLAHVDTLWPVFNKNEVVYPQNKTLFAVIWEHSNKYLHEKALVSQDSHVTSYEQLRERVLAIASHFSAIGVAAGDKVLLYLPKNKDTLCSMLACWYLGAAYIPIDNKSPLAWVLTILDDAKPALVVHDKDTELSIDYSGVCTCIPQEIVVSKKPQMQSDSLNQLAYIIYTSGSTGTPKGVMINHGQLLNYVFWAADAYSAHQQPYHTALFTSLAFDLTVTALFLPLITGGSILMCPESVTSLTLKSLLTNPSLNFLKLTPSHLRMISNLSIKSDNPITLVVGGEALPCKLAQSMMHKLPFARIFNEYGPTETTVGCMIHEYNLQEDTHGSVPIGLPAANTRIYCLDNELKPVKIGQEGEIYIAGNNVGVGYLHKPEATAISFLSDSFYPGQRMYRSGDLAKHREDGLLIYLGRKDQQAKIRGHRIELSEIENSILAINGVLQTVAVLKKMDDSIGEKSDVLIAYIVTNSVLNPSLIRKKMAATLPYYMLPKHFIFLEELPMTINGKVDQKKLPEPESVSHITAVNEQADLLTKIRQLFANTLSLPIDIIDNNVTFEEMGGDSIQLAYMMNEILSKMIPPMQHAVFSEQLEHLLTHATPHNFYQQLSQMKE